VLWRGLPTKLESTSKPVVHAECNNSKQACPTRACDGGGGGGGGFVFVLVVVVVVVLRYEHT